MVIIVMILSVITLRFDGFSLIEDEEEEEAGDEGL